MQVGAEKAVFGLALINYCVLEALQAVKKRVDDCLARSLTGRLLYGGSRWPWAGLLVLTCCIQL